MGTAFRGASVYFESKKVAEIESGTYDHESGDEDMIGTDGWLGASDGADMVKLEFTTVSPVKGHETALKNAILQKKYVRIGIVVDGSQEQWEGRMRSRSYNWDSKTGACKGKFSFTGGKPDVS